MRQEISDKDVLEQYCEAAELTATDIQLICQDLEDLRDINAEFVTMLAQQGASINALTKYCEKSETNTLSGVKELQTANACHSSFMRYRFIFGMGLGALVAGPVGCVLGAKVATGAFVLTSVITSLF